MATPEQAGIEDVYHVLCEIRDLLKAKSKSSSGLVGNLQLECRKCSCETTVVEFGDIDGWTFCVEEGWRCPECA